MQAYEKREELVYNLRASGMQSMECTEDKAGIVWERFTSHTRHCVVVATPAWASVFWERDAL
jgi:hypothetical protein